MISVPIRTVPGMNVREHWRARAARVHSERRSTFLTLAGLPKPSTPLTVRLTRVAPSNGLDSDNLAGSMKAIRDEVAAWLGVDDKHENVVRYVYAQRRGQWAVEIEFGEPMKEAEFKEMKRAHAFTASIGGP